MRRRIENSSVGFLTALALIALSLTGATGESANAAGSTNQSITVDPIRDNISALETFSISARSSSGLPVEISVKPVSSARCSISGTTVTSLAAGLCYLLVNQAGDDTYAPAPQVEVVTAMSSLPQVVTYSYPGSISLLDAPRQISAVSSSGSPVLFQVVTIAGVETHCAVTTTGVVTPISLGPCNLALYADQNQIYARSSPVSLGFNVTKAPQSSLVISAPSTMLPGAQALLQVTGGSGLGEITLAASGDCSLSGFTLIASSSGSSCTITATKATDATYLPATASLSFTIATVPTGGGSGGSGSESSSGGSAGGAPTPVVTTPQLSADTSADSNDDIDFVLDEAATQLLKPSLDARDLWAHAGGQLVFKGRNLQLIKQVLVGEGLEVKIVSSTDIQMNLEFPRGSLVGFQTITLKTNRGLKTYPNGVNYLAAPSAVKPVVKILKGFEADQKTLSKSQKVALKKYVKAVGAFKMVDCRGLAKPIYMTCKYLKTIYKAGKVRVTKLKLKPASAGAKQVRLIFSR